MSEEEIIERIKDLLHTCDIGIEKHGAYDDLFKLDKEALQGLLDLYQTEKIGNANLQILLDEEKEKNKELEKYKKYYETEKVVWSRKDCISKDKIKEFIEKNTKYISFGEQDTYLQGQRDENDEIMDKLQELLEERN